MPQKYAGRVTLILVVLLVSLFGIPGVVNGIFSLSRFLSPKYSFSEKLNLKPGIDIAGGTSLLYEIKPPPGGFHGTGGTMAEQVAAILKKRVDPTGTRNLIWRPQGDTRLEIQLPRSSMSREGTAQVKRQYSELTDSIRSYNLNLSQVLHAVERLGGDARREQFKKLARGIEARELLFSQLAAHYDNIKGLETQLAGMKKATTRDDAKILATSEKLAQARIDYSKARDRIENTNVQIAELESALALTNAEIKNKEMATIKAKAAPPVQGLIQQFESLYPKYVEVRSALADAADLKRLLRGSGVIEFHIMVDDPGREHAEMVRRLEDEGAISKAGDQTRWFEVARPEQYQRPTFLNPRDNKRYALAWVTSDKSMVHAPGGQDWVLENAYPDQDQGGAMCVGFEFDNFGAKLFGVLTGNNLGQPLGTILDNKVITAPNIQSAISKRGIITGKYTDAERMYLVNTLKAGALPAQLAEEPVSEREVGPQLGEANLRAGLNACIVGLIIAAAFLVIYYHLAGVIAISGLILNFIIILGISAMMGATFTLPGIAALVLTTGMAVDANVLIFERLREEQLRGLSLRMALRNAYDRAYTAILDSNVTTAITSAFLILFGSEEVKGFGITLLVGILSSLFGALFVTKTIFGVLLERFGLKKLGSLPLSFPKWNDFLRPNVDWMGKVKYFIVASVLIMVLGMFAFFKQSYNRQMFDVEFQSGTEVQFATNALMTDLDVRKLIEDQKDDIPQPQVVAVGEETDNKYKLFSVVTANADRRKVEQAILAAMKGKLDITMPSTFELSSEKPGDTFAQALQKQLIRPIAVKEGRFQIDGRDIPDAIQHADGVAIILNNIDPPLRPDDIRSRIDRALVESGNHTLGAFDVVRLDGRTEDRNTVTDHAVVLMSSKNFAYSKGETDWRDKLSLSLWSDINAGVTRHASLQKVANFDPQVAQTTQQDAAFALLGSIIFIMIWIWVRFGDHTYGTATVVAMVHDTVFVIAAIGWSHWLAGFALIDAFRVNMTLVAAVLTVMGYSLSDTIVVFDRIREIRGKYGLLSRGLINDAINQTLSRTLLTAGTTLMTLLVMYIWGGAAIHGFTFVLFVGIIIGTFSSIGIAAPILLIGIQQPAGQKTGPVTGVQAPPAGAVQKA